MLAGLSNVGSLDAGINMALVFSDWMREGLAGSANFDAFYNGLMARTAAVVAETLDQVNDFSENPRRGAAAACAHAADRRLYRPWAGFQRRRRAL